MDLIKKDTKIYRILVEIDRHGIMTVNQLLQWLDTCKGHVSYSVNKLEKLGFIKVCRIYKEHCYYITQAGSEYVGLINFGYTQTEKEPNTTILQHNLKMVEASFQSLKECCKNEPTKQFYLITERENLAWWYTDLERKYSGRTLMREKAALRKKLPDYLIRFEANGEECTVAYELELTRKSHEYLLRKLKWYADQLSLENYQVIYYVCENKKIFNYVFHNAEKCGVPVYYQQFEPMERK
ncbi:hypothetical protein IGK80_001132 [Enterococcus sp. DIV0609]|uniref:MarR family transcriptional regulator n=1 Tax=unclassified Enterococcus TaxID=2608891 RepID=UPI003F238032